VALATGPNDEEEGRDSSFKTSHSGTSFDGQRKINKLSIYLVTVMILAQYTALKPAWSLTITAVCSTQYIQWYLG